MKKPAVVTATSREAFLDENVHPLGATVTDKAIDDLKFFATKAAEGRPITFGALARWMQDKHGLVLGRTRLHTLLLKNGMTPWLKKAN